MEKELFSRIKNTIIPYVLFLSIMAGTNFVDLPKSFAQEKSKAEKKSRFSIPDWLNLHMDISYTEGKNYNLKSQMTEHSPWNGINLDVDGKNIYDLSLGASILSHFKNIPIFFDVNVSNLHDGTKKPYLRSTRSNIYMEFLPGPISINLKESYPFISYSIGSTKCNSDYIFNTAVSYSTNINNKDKSSFKNYSFSASISKSYKKAAITPAIGFIKKHSIHRQLINDIKINENIIGLELNISYPFKHIAPYISCYSEIYKTQSIERQDLRAILNKRKSGTIIKAGIHISTSNLSNWFKGISGSIFHQSDIQKDIFKGFI